MNKSLVPENRKLFTNYHPQCCVAGWTSQTMTEARFSTTVDYGLAESLKDRSEKNLMGAE
jgi:hypothetical protein